MTAISMMTLPSHMTGFLHELGPSTGVYSYVSYPSTILPHTPRAKYRNELQLGKISSLFFDKALYVDYYSTVNFSVQSIDYIAF